MIKKLKDKLKKHFKEVLELKTSPHSIAMGFATGTLIAILPTFGLGIFIGLLVLLIFKKISKISMFISFAIWNPLVLTLLYPLEYGIGNLILSDFPVTKFKFEILNQLFVYTGRFLLGSLILSMAVSFICYFLLLYCITKYQKEKLGSFQKEIAQAKEILKI